MIGDLTSAPEPIQIKLFSQDPNCCASGRPKLADTIKKIDGVVDVLNGIDNTISGPAMIFQVNPTVARAPVSRRRKSRPMPRPCSRANPRPPR